MLHKAKNSQRNNGTLPTLSISLPNHSETFDQSEHDSTVLLEKASTSAKNTKNPAKFQVIVDASQVVLFSAQTLKRAINRCLVQTSNESLQAAFSPTLGKTKSITDRLGHALDSLMVGKTPSQEAGHQLISLTAQCIAALKELCYILGIRLSIFVQGLDPRFSRHLLVSLYSATADIKESWEIICPHLTIDPIYTLPNKSKQKINRNRSNSELTLNSPLISSPLKSQMGDNSLLYTYLKNAVAGSINVLCHLRQSIEEALSSVTIATSLEGKLRELLRQAQHVTDLSHRLGKSIEICMSNKEEPTVLSNRQELSRMFWEDTTIFLKAMVSLMTLIRSISKEEEFVWPRTVKQGCLYVTRMTAEVAKYWNKSSTFAQDGLFLGKSGRSKNNSEQETNLQNKNT